ncbi:uncharacterized protein LOC135826087 isoform X2 [Sycon ciliatum]|uniref:uncharacterized protein LOC135826087 isoform X2 n=1 Tax=Sycon ciliatum TaxID=27933 RepID=UPI0031F6D2D9
MITEDAHRGRNSHRHNQAPLLTSRAGRILLTWLCTIVTTLGAYHVPNHLRMSEKGKDFAFFVWTASLLGCILMVLANWISPRNRVTRGELVSLSLSSLHLEVVVSAVLRAIQAWSVVFFLTSDKFTASGFPVANAVAFGLVPVMISWFGSLARSSHYVHSTLYNQITAVLLTCSLLYAASGQVRTGFYISDMGIACLAAGVAASSKVSTSLAVENSSVTRVVFLRLVAIVVTFPIFMLVLGRSTGVLFWLKHMWKSAGYLGTLAIALPLSDYFQVQLQLITFTPVASAVTDAIAWIISFVLLTFRDRIELLNSALIGAILVVPTTVFHWYAVLSDAPPSDSAAVS